MYNVSRIIHEKYGNTIQISIEEYGTYNSPFTAASQAKLLRRLWLEEGILKVKILINDQIFSVKEMEKWAVKEYHLLPKCHNCANIIDEDVFTHRLCNTNLFCSQKCSDTDYFLEIEKLNDEREIDYL